MNSEDFESRARLYVLGALDDEELTEFERMRHEMGPWRPSASSRNASG